MVASLAFAALVAVLAGQGMPPDPSVQAARCLRVLVPLAADAVPQSAQFAPARCAGGAAAPSFRHDTAADATRLTRALQPGEIVPAYPEYGVDMVLPGQSLRIVVIAGAARVERQVEALQAARPGQRLFVRDGDGEILSVRYEKGAP